MGKQDVPSSFLFGTSHIRLPGLITIHDERDGRVNIECRQPSRHAHNSHLLGQDARKADSLSVPLTAHSAGGSEPPFTFGAYLGATVGVMSVSWLGGIFALAAIFLPSLLLVAGMLPLWSRLLSTASFRQAIMGISAAVVGLLLAVLCDPVWTSAIHASEDLALGLAAFALLALWKWAPWPVMVLGAMGGICLASCEPEPGVLRPA